MATPKKSTTQNKRTLLTKEINSLDERVEQQQREAFELTTINYEDNKTRHQIAKRFVTIYFVLLATIIVGTPVYNIIAFIITRDESILQLELTDLVQTYSAVVGPTLGFVIAYYFKTKDYTR